MKEIEEYKVKRPKDIFFIDIDGTTNLEDKQLNTILHLLKKRGGMVIPVTGRTVGDIESKFKKQKVVVPEIIVGDNGANIYHTKSEKFLKQQMLDHEKVMEIAEYFLEQGGNKDFIRYTNGRNIFAPDTEEAREYYKNSNKAIFEKDIIEALKEAIDITKITFAGSEEEMKQMNQIADNLGFWCDKNPSKFPRAKYQNYILDMAQKNISKGEAVKTIVSELKPEHGFMCIGNGYNDISMFKVAIEFGMIAGVMERSPAGIIKEVQQYSQERKRGRVVVIPKDKNLANEYILKMTNLFETDRNTEKRELREKMQGQKLSRLPNLPRVEVPGVKEYPYKNISRGTDLQKNHRNR